RRPPQVRTLRHKSFAPWEVSLGPPDQRAMTPLVFDQVSGQELKCSYRPQRSESARRSTSIAWQTDRRAVTARDGGQLHAGPDRLALQVEAIQVHDLVPGGHEVVDELALGVLAGVDLGDRPKLG